jgi:hypothetical protein
MTDTEAYDEGYDAYWDGVDESSNPHDAETDKHLSWNEGWLKAKQHDYDESEGR